MLILREIKPNECSSALSRLDAVEVGEQVIDFVGRQTKFRHLGMTDEDALGKGFFQRVQRVVS